jgi:hypothetical protein
MQKDQCQHQETKDSFSGRKAVPGGALPHGDALQTLRAQLYYQPIAQNLLPEKFTLTEIHAVYETILGKKLDIRNFPKKMAFLGLITKLNEKRNIGPHKAPFLYTFNNKKYKRALELGVTLS